MPTGRLLGGTAHIHEVNQLLVELETIRSNLERAMNPDVGRTTQTALLGRAAIALVGALRHANEIKEIGQQERAERTS